MYIYLCMYSCVFIEKYINIYYKRLKGSSFIYICI